MHRMSKEERGKESLGEAEGDQSQGLPREQMLEEGTLTGGEVGW
jgi:hypothetical protein